MRIGYRGYGEEGTLNADRRSLNRIWENARKAGIDVGVYFFSQAVNEEEAKENDFVLEHLKRGRSWMPVVYDPEHILEDEADRRDGVTGEQFSKCEGIL